jgi:MYXO-CTERM domain-containing protein
VAARAEPVADPAGSPSTTVAVVGLLGAGGVLGLTAARRSREPTPGV